MKSQILFALVMLCATGYSQSHRAPSRVKEVTVFISGAQVTRTAVVDLKPGDATIAIEGTSPNVLENSIQVDASPTVKMQGVSFRRSEPKTSATSDERRLIIDREIERIKKLIAEDQKLLSIYDDEEAMLKANRAIGGSGGVNVNELKTAVDYYRSRLLEINSKRTEIANRIENYQLQISKNGSLKSELAPLFEAPKGEILVKVNAATEMRVTFQVTYLVKEASWMPSYDIRATSINKPIVIAYKANIAQHCGEDWEKVKLTVSSGNPTAVDQRPTIEPWILGFNNGVSFENGLQGRMAGVSVSNNIVRGRVLGADGTPLPGVNVVVKGTTNGTVTDVNGNYLLAVSGNYGSLVFSFIGYSTTEVDMAGRSQLDVTLGVDVSQLNEVVVNGYGYAQSSPIRLRGMSSMSSSSIDSGPRILAATPVVRAVQLEFQIDDPFNIKSGGEAQTVDLVEYTVDATFTYYCAPKLDPDVFLTAQLTNWEQYNFMEGQANLFFEGKYIGKTLLDTRNTTDTLTVSLGRDQNVVVKREKVKEYSANQFAGPNRKAQFAYEISVRNKKALPINIRVEDQLPVPNNKDIAVEEGTISKAIKDEDTGILTWNLKVAPGKTEKRDLRYEIRYPKGRSIILE